MGETILGVGLLVFLGHLFLALFKKTGIPDVLLLMIIGILLGPYVFNLLTPADFGKVGSVLTTIALIIILFEGGANLDLKGLRSSILDSTTITLTTFAVSIFIITTLALLFLTDSFLTGLLLGVILGGTSSAVVIPMITIYRLETKPKLILFLESALTDVLCIVFAFGLFEAIKSGEFSTGHMIGKIISSLIMASVIGAIGGFGWSMILNKIRQFPNTIFTTFAYLFILYGIAESLGFSGAITALFFGVTISNLNGGHMKRTNVLKDVKLEQFTAIEKSLFSEMVFLLKLFFFIYLGISLVFTDISLFFVGSIITLLVYTARMIITRLLLKTDVSRHDAIIVSVMVPKGLAAAVLATVPVQMNLPGAEIIQSTVYAVVFMSIIFTSILIPLIHKTSVGIAFNIFFQSFENRPNIEIIDVPTEKITDYQDENKS